MLFKEVLIFIKYSTVSFGGGFELMKTADADGFVDLMKGALRYVPRFSDHNLANSFLLL